MNAGIFKSYAIIFEYMNTKQKHSGVLVSFACTVTSAVTVIYLLILMTSLLLNALLFIKASCISDRKKGQLQSMHTKWLFIQAYVGYPSCSIQKYLRLLEKVVVGRVILEDTPPTWFIIKER